MAAAAAVAVAVAVAVAALFMAVVALGSPYAFSAFFAASSSAVTK